MDGKHILAMIFTSLLLVISSSFSADHYQTLFTTLLPTRQTDEEALSWDIQSESEPEPIDTNTSSSFLVKLQHLDNLSPPDTSSETLLNTRLKRDSLRVDRLFTITKLAAASATPRTNADSGDFSSPVNSGLEMGSGEYFTRIGVGTPPKYLYMILDTGSDLIWLQCSPCLKCYEQVDPIFEPNKSTSFSGVGCGSSLCSLLDKWKCGRRKQCIFGEWYGDGSFVIGDFSTETLTFGKKKTKVRQVALGCGRDNEGLFVAAAGLLGLGRGKLSFPSQTHKKFGNKFSYCLATPNNKSSSSHLIFGKKSSTAYGKAVYTSLLKNPNPKLQTFYYVGLEGISVGGSRVRGINASTFEMEPKNGDGGVIIDSGTVVTRLPNHAYLALRDAFRNAAKHLKPASKFSILDTCYNLSGMSEVQVPTVDLHFCGATVSLPASNCLIPVDNNGTHCFALAGTVDSDGGLFIIGNIQQQGFGVAFDLANKRVGFVPKAC